MTRRTLAVAFFPTPFSGEAAMHELGLHRVEKMAGEAWRTEWLELDAPGFDAGLAALERAAPDLVAMHVHRTQVRDALAFVAAAARARPEVPLLWCGWTANTAYVDAAFEQLGHATHPALLLACGEPEAVLLPVLAATEAGRGSPEELATLPGIVAWRPRERAWAGRHEFHYVRDLAALPSAWIEHIPKAHLGQRCGWLELSRGCIYRCSFCLASAFPMPAFRRHTPARITAEMHDAATRGVEVLGLLSASNSFDEDLLRAVVASVRELGWHDALVAGPVHARWARGEGLALLSSLRWALMTIGLQTINADAQKLLRRRDDPEEFARDVEAISAFATPEIELILGLPGDSPEGFRRTIEYALGLPANLTVHTLRLDPWSTFLVDRAAHGIRADFADSGRVLASRDFPEAELAACTAWLERLSAGPWPHRARHLALDGRQLH